MIDVYTQGSQVGISLHGWGGFLLLFYFIIEMIFLFTTKSLLIHKFIIWFRIRKEVKKMIPNWWKIDIVNIITIKRLNTGYKVYVQIKSKLSDYWTNDYIIVDWLGRIKNQKLIENIKFYDIKSDDKIKSWKRNKTLEDIGV